MIWYVIIALNIIAVIAFFVLIFVYRRKFLGIKHYEKIRDKVTLREKPKKVDVDATGNATGTLGSLIGGFIVLIVGINLMGVITSESVQSELNITGTAASNILSLTPFFIILGIVAAVGHIMINTFRRGGIL